MNILLTLQISLQRWLKGASIVAAEAYLMTCTRPPPLPGETYYNSATRNYSTISPTMTPMLQPSSDALSSATFSDDHPTHHSSCPFNYFATENKVNV